MNTKQYFKVTNHSITRYLQDIGKIKLLTAEEELELAKRIQEGDKTAMEPLIKANLRFVVSIAKQYQNQGLPLDDLINEGNMGLFKAAQKFDPSRGFKFISYAVWWIRQSIMQAISEQSRLVRLPLNRVSTIQKISKANHLFEQDYTRNPNTAEIAEELNMDEEEIKFAMQISGKSISLDAQFNSQDETSSLLDILSNENESSPDSSLVDESLKDEVKRALDGLHEREAHILKRYFGIDCDISMTLEEIGEQLNITRERVRQIKEKALRKLKHSSETKKLKVYLG